MTIVLVYAYLTLKQLETISEWIYRISYIHLLSFFANNYSTPNMPNEIYISDNYHTLPFMYYMMSSSNGSIFRVTGPLCWEFIGPGEFPTQRPVTRSFDVFFHLRLNKRLSKQPWGWWFETPSWSLWRHRNVNAICWIFSVARHGKKIDTEYVIMTVPVRQPYLMSIAKYVKPRQISTSKRNKAKKSLTYILAMLSLHSHAVSWNSDHPRQIVSSDERISMMH